MDYKKLIKVVDSRNVQEINKVVNVDEDGEITVLQEIFNYDDGCKGATGSRFYPISEGEYEERTTREAIAEFLEGATELYPEYDSYEDWADAIIANGEEGEVMFDNSYSNLWDMMREECGLSEEDAYVFDCVGGGRMFDANYQGNVNPELSELIRKAESK